jgi:hypothetical protein
MYATGAVAIAAFAMLADLLLVGHTMGDQIWGPVTAAMAAAIGALALGFLGLGGRRRVARLGLYALWLTVAFFGFGGYQSHRLVVAGSEASAPPPLAPLVFTGLGIAGALSLRYGTKED